MTAQSTVLSTDVIAFDLDFDYYLYTASFVLLCYDHILTLSDEIEFFWKAKPSCITTFFLATRYLCFFTNIPIALKSWLTWSESTCNILIIYHDILAVIIQALVAFFLILRTYALVNRNKKVLLLLVSVTLIVVGLGSWAIATYTNASITPEGSSPIDSFSLGCIVMVSNLDGDRLAIAWSGLLLFDSVVVTITVYQGLGPIRAGGHGIVKTLVRDGVLYYLVMAAAHLSNILTYLLGDPLIKGVVTTLANNISITMISRIMINLRAHTNHNYSDFHILDLSDSTNSTSCQSFGWRVPQANA